MWKRNIEGSDAIDFLLINIPVIIGLILGEYFVYKEDGNFINTGITVALIAVAGTLAGNMLTLLRDRSTLSRIDSRSSEIAPKTENIRERTDKIAEYSVEKIYPKLDNLDLENQSSHTEILDIIKNINNDIEYRKRLASEYSNCSKDTVVNSVESIYKENAALVHENRILSEENQKLKVMLNKEMERNKELSGEIIKYRSKERGKDFDIEL